MEYKKDLNNLQNVSLNLVLDCLRENDNISANAISDKISLSLPSVHKYLNYLFKNNMIIKNDTLANNHGKKATLFSLNPYYSHYLLLFIANDQIITKVLNYKLVELETKTYKLSYSKFKDTLINTIYDILSTHNKIRSIMISLHAIVNNGEIINYGEYSHLNDNNLKQLIESKFNISCFIFSNIATLAYANLKSRKDSLVVGILDGEVSIASIIDNNVHNGLDYLNKYTAPATFRLPNITAYELVLKTAISILAPKVVIIYAGKNKQESCKKLIELLNNHYPDKLKPNFIYKDAILDDIFSGLKVAAIKNTPLKYIGE